MTKTTEKKNRRKSKSDATQKEDDKDSKIAELTELVQRVQADFENYKKRTEKNQASYMQMGKVLVVKKLLPVLDSFEKAVEQDEDTFIPLYRQLLNNLETVGLTPIKAIGSKFDPHMHHCVEEESCDEPKGIVTQELAKGYIMGGFLVRSSMVKVSKGKKEGENDNNS